MKQNKKQTFALYFGNRGFFPASLIASARDEVAAAVEKAGFDYLMPPSDMLTAYALLQAVHIIAAASGRHSNMKRFLGETEPYLL